MNLPVLPPIELQASDTPETAAGKLQLQPKSIVLLLGNFDASFQPKVRSILSRAVAPLAVDSGALIVDNGATSGSAAAMGLASRDQDTAPALLAIMAHDASPCDPNHTRVLRLPAEWPDAIKVTFQIAGQLAKGPDDREKPVLAILFGGSDEDQPSLIQCARRQWPILLIEGSGGLADKIVAAKAAAKLAAGTVPRSAEGTEAKPIDDPALAEIVETASLTQFRIAGPIDSLERILVAHLEMRVHTLADAWARFDDLDGAAVLKQRSFKRIQGALLILGVVATLLAISQSNSAPWFKNLVPVSLKTAIQPYLGAWAGFVHILMILAPIAISVLVAANSRFREGNKWILLRSAAESIKREICRYRAQAGAYSNQQCGEISREARLAAKIKDITSALVQSEVNKANLQHIPNDQPERLKFLSPEEYAKDRLENQIDFLVGKTARLSYQLKRNQLCIYLAGGLGTFLAAINSDVWVALTTSLATALTTKLESEQVENSLVQYNQALTALLNIKTWWKALSQWEKGRRKNIDLLVEQTEQTMEFELSGWVQQMQSALDKLTEKESGGTEQAKAAEA